MSAVQNFKVTPDNRHMAHKMYTIPTEIHKNTPYEAIVIDQSGQSQLKLTNSGYFFVKNYGIICKKPKRITL